MSQTPNNPFDSYPNQPPQQQPQSNNTWLWVLGILGGLFLVGGMVCCGAVWYVSTQMTGLIADAAMEEFKNDPVVVEHIGEITESEINFAEAINESSKDEDVAVMVIKVKGDKGSGRILHRTNNSTGELKVVLEMDNGDTYPLEIEDEFDYAEELQEMEAMETEQAMEPAEAESTEAAADNPS